MISPLFTVGALNKVVFNSHSQQGTGKSSHDEFIICFEQQQVPHWDVQCMQQLQKRLALLLANNVNQLCIYTRSLSLQQYVKAGRECHQNVHVCRDIRGAVSQSKSFGGGVSLIFVFVAIMPITPTREPCQAQGPVWREGGGHRGRPGSTATSGVAVHHDGLFPAALAPLEAAAVSPAFPVAGAGRRRHSELVGAAEPGPAGVAEHGLVGGATPPLRGLDGSAMVAGAPGLLVVVPVGAVVREVVVSRQRLLLSFSLLAEVLLRSLPPRPQRVGRGHRGLLLLLLLLLLLPLPLLLLLPVLQEGGKGALQLRGLLLRCRALRLPGLLVDKHEAVSPPLPISRALGSTGALPFQ